MNSTEFTPDLKNKKLTVERVFDAPREKVWQAWTDAKMFAKWWGPRGWSTTVKQMDFTEGGYLLYGMKCEDKNQTEWYGQVSWGKSIYKSIDEPNEFRYVDYFCDADGKVNKEMPVITITIKFNEVDGKTRVTSHSVFESESALKQVIDMGMEEGLKQTWDRLAETLAKRS